ncbi:hypothetical protein STTU_p0137 (plasmid) [Streptomyces sp. Tu6071]|nr:hypothetical protein STTU_p0137 [Streptomyces sp. Tu6071]
MLKYALRPKARRSAAVEAPLVEAPVDVRFEALRGVKAHGLTPVHGDEGVLAPPPRVGHTLYFGYRLECAEIQCVDGLALDPRDGRGPAAGMSGERQGFHPSVSVGMQGRPLVGVDAERTVGADREAVGHGNPAAPCRERPAFCGHLLGAVGIQDARTALVERGRRQGEAAPAVLEGSSPLDLRSGDPVLDPRVAVSPDVRPANTYALRLDKPLGPTAQAGRRDRDGRYGLVSHYRCSPSPAWSTADAISRTRSGLIPVRCSTARGWSVGSSSTKGRSPTGRVWTRVFRLSVVAGYTGRSVVSQPKYGFSASRPGLSHRSEAWEKLSRLSETQTPQENTSALPMTGISIRPFTK